MKDLKLLKQELLETNKKINDKMLEVLECLNFKEVEAIDLESEQKKIATTLLDVKINHLISIDNVRKTNIDKLNQIYQLEKLILEKK